MDCYKAQQRVGQIAFKIQIPNTLDNWIRLTLKSGKFVHYEGKGWRVFALMEWLEVFLADKEIDPDLRMIVWSGNFLMGSLHIWRDSSTLLENWQQQELHTVGEFHLNILLALHEKYKGFCAYGLFQYPTKLPHARSYF